MLFNTKRRLKVAKRLAKKYATEFEEEAKSNAYGYNHEYARDLYYKMDYWEYEVNRLQRKLNMERC